jgi:hypothetical protein
MVQGGAKKHRCHLRLYLMKQEETKVVDQVLFYNKLPWFVSELP